MLISNAQMPQANACNGLCGHPANIYKGHPNIIPSKQPQYVATISEIATSTLWVSTVPCGTLRSRTVAVIASIRPVQSHDN